MARKFLKTSIVILLLIAAGFIGFMLPHTYECKKSEIGDSKILPVQVASQKSFYGKVVSRKDMLLSVNGISNEGESTNDEFHVRLTGQTAVTYQKPQDQKSGWDFMSLPGTIEDIKEGDFVHIVGMVSSAGSATLQEITASSATYSQRSPFQRVIPPSRGK